MKVYTGGTFDLFHAGHVNFLRQCKKIAGRYSGEVVVALNTDKFVEQFKGRPPIYPYRERKRILESCDYVEEVVENKRGKDSKPTIKEVSPDCIVIGDDWVNKDYYKQMRFTREWLEKRDILLCYIPYTQGISSTEVKKRCLEQS